jgi:hypothetical protein
MESNSYPYTSAPCLYCGRGLEDHTAARWELCYDAWDKERRIKMPPKFTGFDNIPDWTEKDRKIAELQSQLVRSQESASEVKLKILELQKLLKEDLECGDRTIPINYVLNVLKRMLP